VRFISAQALDARAASRRSAKAKSRREHVLVGSASASVGTSGSKAPLRVERECAQASIAHNRAPRWRRDARPASLDHRLHRGPAPL
jgi:hypothetical protein